MTRSDLRERIDDGRFADVRPADNRQPQRAFFAAHGRVCFAFGWRGNFRVGNFRFGTGGGQISRRRVHQIFDAFAVNRADRKHFLEAEPGKFVHVFFREAGVHLVDRDQNRLAAGPQFLRDLAVERHDAFLHIDDENDRARGFDGDFHLLQRGFDDDVRRISRGAAGRCRRCPRA